MTVSPSSHLDMFSRLTSWSSDMYEARAVLLGRLGNHEAALQIYVHRLEDYDKAEECVLVCLALENCEL